jgi:flagellar biosynthetic protein FliP
MSFSFETIKKTYVRAIIAFAFAVASAASFGTAASAQVAPVDVFPSVVDAAITATTTVPAVTNGNTSTAANTPAASTPTASGPAGPAGPSGDGTANNASVNLNLDQALNKPSQSILIIIVITVLSVSPALLIMLTSFTRIIIVLSLTRNALGVMTIPPTQVLTGLALFLSFFIMTPTFTAMNNDAVQPYLRGELTQEQAYDTAVKPLKTFMLKQTRKEELALFTEISGDEKPTNAEELGMSVLAPAFILSEIKTAFIIGFIIFIPFLVIDIIVSSSLMAMGMMMLPPQMIALPFKILLFVLVDGWGLVIKALIASFA